MPTYIGLDTTTKGDWPSLYDGGFVPPSVDPAAGTSVPAYVTSIANTDSASVYPWFPEDNRDEALKRVPSGQGYLVGWYSDNLFRFRFVVNQACRVGVYCWDSDLGARQIEVSLLGPDGETPVGTPPDPVGGPYGVANYTGGVWFVWDVEPGTYYVAAIRTAGANAVVNGIFFKAEGGGDQYDEVGEAGGSGLPASGPHAATAPAAAASGRGSPAAVVQVLAHPATSSGAAGYAAAVVASSGTASEVGKAGGSGLPAAVVHVVSARSGAAGGRGLPAAVVGSSSADLVVVASAGSGRPAAVVSVASHPPTAARGSGYPAAAVSPPKRPPVAVHVVALGKGRPAATVQVLAAASVAAIGLGRPAAKVREVLDLTANVDPFRCVLVVDPAADLEIDPESAELVQ